MSTRRRFIQSLPTAGTAFAVARHPVMEDNPARAQVATVPLKEHFHLGSGLPW
jgi:linear primary-alkylsulfatase